MKEVMIKIGAADNGGYPVELFERDGDHFNPLGALGTLELTAAELSSFAQLLPGPTPAPALWVEGGALYDKLRAALGPPLDDVMNGKAARIYLDLGAPELHSVPWETMVWQKATAFGSVQTWVSQAHHLCRVFKPDWTARPPETQGPLRILIAIGVPAGDDVKAEEEEQEIRRRTQPSQRTVDIETIRPLDRAALYNKIKDFIPHVLHFIGHATSTPPELNFQGWVWRAGEVTADVGRYNLNGWTPGLTFLNACRTAGGAGQLAPMAGAFLDSGARAAVAMQGNIKGLAAGTLAGVFYEKLAAGVAINEALSAARGEVAQCCGYKEAAYPALTIRLAPEATLPPFECLGEDYRQRVNTCELLPRLTVFVNQEEPRRDLCRNFWPFRPADLRQRFVLLRGDSGYGKTVLSAWMLDLSLRVGHRVRYVKVASGKGIDYIEILKLIWKARLPGIDSPLMDPLPIKDEKLAEQLESSKGTKDTAVYGPFLQALADVAKDRPLTIVLDEFKKSMDIGSFWTLWEHLFVPLAGQQFKNINLVLVLGDDDYKEYEIEQQLRDRPELKVSKKEIRLRPLDRDEFVKRFGEYLYFRSERFRDQELREHIDRMARASTANEQQPLSVARFEEKAKHLAAFMGLDIGELN